jgi:hypothetical protein
MIHPAQQKCSQVANVTRDQKGCDLAPAIAQELVAARKPIAEKADIRGVISLGNEIARTRVGAVWRIRFSASESSCQHERAINVSKYDRERAARMTVSLH